MAADEFVTALKTELETVLKYVDSELITRSEWGGINFEKASADIEDALSISRDLNGMPLEHLTDGIASRIQASIPEVTQALQQIAEFSLDSGGTPSENRDNICINLHNAVDNFRHSACSWIPYLMYKKGDAEENIVKLEETIAKSQSLYDEAETWVDEKKAEIEKSRVPRALLQRAPEWALSRKNSMERQRSCKVNPCIG